MRKSEISESGRKLIAVMQEVNYGRLMNVKVFDGELVFTPDSVVERDVRFGKNPEDSGYKIEKDYELKKPLADFFRHLAEIHDGEISNLEIQAGLPCLMRERRKIA